MIAKLEYRFVYNVLVADDHPMVREGVAHVVSRTTDLRVVAVAGDGREVMQALRTHLIDVAVLDITMPGTQFLDLVQALRTRVTILVFTVCPEDGFAVRALRAGVAGYLTKGAPAATILEAIRQVASGRRYISPDLAEQVFVSDADRPLHDKLSHREFQVLAFFGKGRSVSDIAGELSLSPKTISTYRTRLLDKVRCTSTSELIRNAIRNGLAG